MRAEVKIRLIAVGKIREPYVAAAARDFRGRLARYGNFEEIEVAASDGADARRAVREESERVARALEPGDVFWLLDRAGAQLSSTELAARISHMATQGTGRLALAVAGTYGASEALVRRADFVWSLSELTFLHEWARLIVLEQLYRAAKIARNEPYHH
jgi:23S rRNA (pseudouridine1915-N3)-methyltransferase